MATLGERIKEERERRKLTQRALADAIGKTDRFISNIERGQRQPAQDTLLAIAGVFKIEPGKLFEKVPATYAKLNADAVQLASLLKDASAQDRKTAIDMVRSFVKSRRSRR